MIYRSIFPKTTAPLLFTASKSLSRKLIYIYIYIYSWINFICGQELICSKHGMVLKTRLNVVFKEFCWFFFCSLVLLWSKETRNHEDIKLSSLERHAFYWLCDIVDLSPYCVPDHSFVKTSFCVTIKFPSLHIKSPQMTTSRVRVMLSGLKVCTM